MTNIFISSNSNHCNGRCVSEMEKNLDSDVISEFFEVVKDFHNDNKTSAEMKNKIVSETKKIINSINEKTVEMLHWIDEIFLSRRRSQSSFYRLCHELARTGIAKKSSSPDESECVCFNEENLKKYNVDPDATSNIRLLTNFMQIDRVITKLFCEIQCTKCMAVYSKNTCDCAVPTITSQHKVHEAILNLCENKDLTVFKDSWYLTQLKRDADYYRSRTSTQPMSTTESIDSFEVISVNKELDHDDENNVNHKYSCFEDSPDLKYLSLQPSNTESTLDYCKDNSFVQIGNCMDITDTLHGKQIEDLTQYEKLPIDSSVATTKLTPADVIKKSFSCYFSSVDSVKASSYITNSNRFFKVKYSPVESLTLSAEKLRVGSKIQTSNYSETVTPNDALKMSLNLYFGKGITNKWLRK